MAKLAFTDALPMRGTTLKIPQLGYGTGGLLGDACPTALVEALKVGFRHIDTAQLYRNEAEVGQGIKQSDVPREDMFVATKIQHPGETTEETYERCLESIKKLDDREGGYVDLFLIHNANIGPFQRKDVWGVLERLQAEGKVKAIGVSNYGPAHLEEMKEYAKVWPPMVNQIEVSLLTEKEPPLTPVQVPNISLQLHPWAQQKEVTAYCEKNGIIVVAYCPMVRNRRSDNPTLVSVADKLGVTPNQILLRYCLQKGIVPLTKSSKLERMKTNSDLYGWEIPEAEMNELDALDQGIEGAICPHNWPLNIP